MIIHPDVLAAHAQFGGDLELMQKAYDWSDLKAEIEHLRLALSEARATGRREGMEEAARIIDANCIMDTSGGKTLSPRQEGNRDGLHYAAAIRAAMEKAE